VTHTRDLLHPDEGARRNLMQPTRGRQRQLSAGSSLELELSHCLVAISGSRVEEAEMTQPNQVQHHLAGDGQRRCTACDRLVYRTSRDHWWHVDTEDEGCPRAASGDAMTVTTGPSEPG
jgi:hypothetical protein